MSPGLSDGFTHRGYVLGVQTMFPHYCVAVCHGEVDVCRQRALGLCGILPERWEGQLKFLSRQKKRQLYSLLLSLALQGNLGRPFDRFLRRDFLTKQSQME